MIYDAILKNPRPHPFFESKMVGYIFEDKLDRFGDGECITTSSVKKHVYSEDGTLESITTRSGTVYKVIYEDHYINLEALDQDHLENINQLLKRCHYTVNRIAQAKLDGCKEFYLVQGEVDDFNLINLGIGLDE